MAFFGLTELQTESQYLFQGTFNLRFKVPFPHKQNIASKTHKKLPDNKVHEIKRLNHLDVRLYEFAREVILNRYESMRAANDKSYRHE